MTSLERKKRGPAVLFERLQPDSVANGRESIGRGMQSSVFDLSKSGYRNSDIKRVSSVERVVKLPNVEALLRLLILTGGHTSFLWERYKLANKMAEKYFSGYFLPTKVIAFHAAYPIIVQEKVQFTPLTSQSGSVDEILPDLREIAERSASLYQDEGVAFDLLGAAVFGLLERMEQDQRFWSLENVGEMNGIVSDLPALREGRKLCLFDLGMIQLRNPTTVYDRLARLVCLRPLREVQKRLQLVFVPED